MQDRPDKTGLEFLELALLVLSSHTMTMMVMMMVMVMMTWFAETVLPSTTRPSFVGANLAASGPCAKSRLPSSLSVCLEASRLRPPLKCTNKKIFAHIFILAMAIVTSLFIAAVVIY